MRIQKGTCQILVGPQPLPAQTKVPPSFTTDIPADGFPLCVIEVKILLDLNNVKLGACIEADAGHRGNGPGGAAVSMDVVG